MKFKLNELNWPTLILILILVFGVIYLLIKGAGTLRDWFTKTDAEKIADEIDDDVSKPGNAQTLSSLQLQQSAEQLHSAMARFGTDEEAIIRIFNQLQTLGDLQGLIKAFGLRPYAGDGSGGFINSLFETDKNLIQWIQADASDIIPTINEILVSKAITFQL